MRFDHPCVPLASQPESIGTPPAAEERLDGLLNRIQRIASGDSADQVEQDAQNQREQEETIDAITDGTFFPKEPKTIADSGLSETQVEELILKFLLARGDAEGRQIAFQVKIPFAIVDEMLRRLKLEQMVAYRNAAAVNDYQYQLTENGRDRARRYANDCSYYGAAPVTLTDYIDSVNAQSLQNQQPKKEDLQRAFSDLLINEKMFLRLGPAVNSGRGMFLFGYPGNGKTSIAELGYESVRGHRVDSQSHRH